MDADIEGFFDNIDRDWLVNIHRTSYRRQMEYSADSQMAERRGFEGTRWTDNVQGTPQGAILSPLLANRFCTTFLIYRSTSSGSIPPEAEQELYEGKLHTCGSVRGATDNGDPCRNRRFATT